MSDQQDVKHKQICIEYDKWMEDVWVHSTRWIALLSNSKTVWQDDGRPGVEDLPAWVRLKNYCEEENEYIKELQLQFRSNNSGKIYSDADGFFFSKLLKASFKSARKMKVFNSDYYLIGRVLGDEVHIDKWNIPALVLEEQFIRKTDDCLDNIIWSNNV